VGKRGKPVTKETDEIVSLREQTKGRKNFFFVSEGSTLVVDI
jgi:hypothetical protein